MTCPPTEQHYRAHHAAAGTADPLIRQQITRYQALIPGSQLVWLPGLNHVPISDNPTAVARRMLTFLRQITPQALTAA